MNECSERVVLRECIVVIERAVLDVGTMQDEVKVKIRMENTK